MTSFFFGGAISGLFYPFFQESRRSSQRDSVVGLMEKSGRTLSGRSPRDADQVEGMM